MIDKRKQSLHPKTLEIEKRLSQEKGDFIYFEAKEVHLDGWFSEEVLREIAWALSLYEDIEKGRYKI